MKVKFRKLVSHAFEPSYAKPGDAGMDLRAIGKHRNPEHGFVEFDTGLAFEIPEGHVGLVFPRSSISKTPHTLANSVGVVDSGYRGEVKVRMRYQEDNEHLEYQPGDRVAQLVILPYPQVDLEEVKELSSTDRGNGGFGSSGN